eukprot:TRINITY_DN10575_c0_g2_i2.p1 TRINITY_DN10575_c0_g2~~TRINITY_DN10575_c0_g2_i2.p1  ORF type:complete len:346 (+),score=35.88 TRINITY_DN10575_c0_g2_i2:66-1040(+)
MADELSEPMLPPQYDQYDADDDAALSSPDVAPRRPSIWRHLGMAVVMVLVISVVAITATQAGHSKTPIARDAVSDSSNSQGPNATQRSVKTAMFAPATNRQMSYSGVMDFASTPSLHFTVDSSQTEHQYLTLRSDREHLFSVHHYPNNRTVFTVINTTIDYKHGQEPRREQIDADNLAMRQLFQHPAMASLPSFSYTMGTEYGASSKQLSIMHAAHMLALTHHRLVGNADADNSPNRRRSCPDQTCSSGSGHPLSWSACNDGCVGMCGPGCSCWHWVCGDCCWHQGCYQHDTQSCANGYVNFDCLTAKGVLWGSETPTGNFGDC